MLLYFIASISRNTVQIYILNKQMSHADSEHELKFVLIAYAFMHFISNFLLQILYDNLIINSLKFIEGPML